MAVNHPRKLWGFDSLPAHHRPTVTMSAAASGSTCMDPTTFRAAMAPRRGREVAKAHGGSIPRSSSVYRSELLAHLPMLASTRSWLPPPRPRAGMGISSGTAPLTHIGPCSNRGSDLQSWQRPRIKFCLDPWLPRSRTIPRFNSKLWSPRSSDWRLVAWCWEQDWAMSRGRTTPVASKDLRPVFRLFELPIQGYLCGSAPPIP